MMIMFKEPKEAILKEFKEEMMMTMMFHQIENINKDMEVMKKNKVEFLELKSTITSRSPQQYI